MLEDAADPQGGDRREKDRYTVRDENLVDVVMGTFSVAERC